MKINTIKIVIIGGLLTVAGCTTTSDSTHTRSLTIISNDTAIREAETKLAEAATSVSSSLRQLAEIERATHPQARLPSPPAAEMIGMDQLASTEWTGPVGPFVEKIAKATHYKLRVLGKHPSIPVLISISAKDIPLASILRDVTFQCGNRANIVVYPASKTIELRYAKN